ncbi:FUSC family protein [Ornithinimicrobium sp. F0845]|uniref:FUSC family protein n=1 Tax=Ornithinimicrobium sp. F0845 TaxID=2926412 RepID=UPI001FF327B7|nr:FUSC family protein [Ornithinimicrobium sp. F0845]MCK0112445.1 FUSC family protein [Ornithinimicrobium sp. F0845]
MSLSLPPRKALVVALIVLGPVLAVAVLAAWWLGLAAAVWVMLGVVAGANVAIARADVPARLGALTVLALAGPLGLLTAQRPWLAALVIALAGLAQAPLNRSSRGLAALAPMLVAFGATSGFPQDPLVALAGTVLGVVTVAATARALGVAKEPEPVGRLDAVVHAAGMAAGAVAALLAAFALDVAHGYWMVLMLAAVLQPRGHLTRQLARDRLVGTLIGLVVAAAIVLLVPGEIAWLLVVPCLVFTLAWTVAGDIRQSVVWGVPLIVLLSSSDLVARADVAAERLLLTAAGVLLAVLLGWACDWLVERLERSQAGVGA